MPAPDPAAELLKNAIADVRAVYRDLEARALPRDCMRRTACCQFQLTGKIPHLTRGEAELAAKALRATGRKTLPERADGACPLLDPATSRCLIYQDRPFGCRTHFCAAAGGNYPREAVLDLIRRLEEIDRMIGGDGAHLLAKAIGNALDRKC